MRKFKFHDICDQKVLSAKFQFSRNRNILIKKQEKRKQNIENFPQNTRSKQKENTMVQSKPSPFRSAQVAGDGR